MDGEIVIGLHPSTYSPSSKDTPTVTITDPESTPTVTMTVPASDSTVTVTVPVSTSSQAVDATSTEESTTSSVTTTSIPSATFAVSRAWKLRDDPADSLQDPRLCQ